MSVLSYEYMNAWLGHSVVRTLNLWSKGHNFNSRLVCYHVPT